MSLLTALHDKRLILQLSSAVRESLCHRPRATVRSTRPTAMAIGPCDFWRLAVGFELLDLHALSNVIAASTATNACVLQSANLRNLLQRKVEEERNLESQNLRIDIGFEEMAALKHSLKIALHVYDALQNSLCFACRRSIPTEERRNIGLGYFKYGLCAGCFEALTTLCTEQDDTLAEQRCIALTDDGVHAAAMLLSAYRAGAECRLSQADAAWVRNVIADSENFLPDLLREVP